MLRVRSKTKAGQDRKTNRAAAAEAALRLKKLSLHLYTAAIPEDKQFQQPQYFEKVSALIEELKDDLLSEKGIASLPFLSKFFNDNGMKRKYRKWILAISVLCVLIAIILFPQFYYFEDKVIYKNFRIFYDKKFQMKKV